MTKLLIMTHGDFGANMLASAINMLGAQADCAALAIKPEFGVEDLAAAAHRQFALWEGDVLILVDMIGGTPWNVAFPFVVESNQREIISGLSLPLLLEALTLRENLSARDLGTALKKMASDSVAQASQLLKGIPSL